MKEPAILNGSTDTSCSLLFKRSNCNKYEILQLTNSYFSTKVLPKIDILHAIFQEEIVVMHVHEIDDFCRVV